MSSSAIEGYAAGEPSTEECVRTNEDVVYNFEPAELLFAEKGDMWGFHRAGVAVMARDILLRDSENAEEEQDFSVLQLHVSVSGSVSFVLQLYHPLPEHTFVKILDRVGLCIARIKSRLESICRPSDPVKDETRSLHEALRYMEMKMGKESQGKCAYGIRVKKHGERRKEDRQEVALMAVVDYDAEPDIAFVNVVSAGMDLRPVAVE